MSGGTPQSDIVRFRDLNPLVFLNNRKAKNSGCKSDLRLAKVIILCRDVGPDLWGSGTG